MPGCLKSFANSSEIVNLAIEHQAVACRGIDYRLVTGWREIQDGQASKSEANARSCCFRRQRKHLKALVVGATMNHRPHHAAHGSFYGPRVNTENAGYAAHADVFLNLDVDVMSLCI